MDYLPEEVQEKGQEQKVYLWYTQNPTASFFALSGRELRCGDLQRSLQPGPRPGQGSCGGVQGLKASRASHDRRSGPDR